MGGLWVDLADTLGSGRARGVPTQAGRAPAKGRRRPMRFLFATGIEGSYPVIDDGRGGTLRRDEMDACGHYDRWREDLELVEGLGVRLLRWGPPIHRTWLGPGRFDWAFCDAVLDGMSARGIIPIVDLCHFGMPDWLGNSFQNPEFAPAFAAYARAFARRYPA